MTSDDRTCVHYGLGSLLQIVGSALASWVGCRRKIEVTVIICGISSHCSISIYLITLGANVVRSDLKERRTYRYRKLDDATGLFVRALALYVQERLLNTVHE